MDGERALGAVRVQSRGNHWQKGKRKCFKINSDEGLHSVRSLREEEMSRKSFYIWNQSASIHLTHKVVCLLSSRVKSFAWITHTWSFRMFPSHKILQFFFMRLDDNKEQASSPSARKDDNMWSLICYSAGVNNDKSIISHWRAIARERVLLSGQMEYESS